MEAAPPSYARATQINYWDIIARYIPSDDLCSAALVCRAWHATFAPHLWGNPASHFGIEDDAVYVALTRFKRTLRTARLVVRSLTHTLHLPPAHAELYNGPHADWLRDILDRLPNLQSLIVRGLPFFDYSALQALRYNPSKATEAGPPEGLVELPASPGIAASPSLDFTPSFGLRFLDASRCPNVTSGSLAQALKRFEGLLYLDLSFTAPARDPVVIKTLYRFNGLLVLKLRGVHLNDDGLRVLAPAIARRVRSLDIRDNEITDRGVRNLLDENFLYEPSDRHSGQRSPGLLSYIGSQMLEIYQGENFESYLRSMFTKAFVGRLAIEGTPEGGITHLYISNNALSVEGLSGLIRSERLHVLDIGAVITEFAKRTADETHGEEDDQINIPGVEKITPVLFKYGSSSLTFLRIDHDLVTKDAPEMHPDEIVQGRVELDSYEVPVYANNAVELQGTPIQPDRFELPEESTPRYELDANPMDFGGIQIPDISAHPVNEDLRSHYEFRRGSAIAPEPIENLTETLDHTDLVSPISPHEGTGTMMSDISLATPASLTVPNTFTDLQNDPLSPGPRPRSYSSVAKERTVRLNAHTSGKHTLHPAMLPHMETLILTNVPPFTMNKDLSDRIIKFVKQCAEEASLAKGQARLDYSLPPGRRGHAAALKYSANKIFALNRLVLELAPESVPRSTSASPWKFTNSKSVTEDRDSESLWSAAETDFSFFGEEEMTLPTLEYGRYADCSNVGQNSFTAGQTPRTRRPETPPQPKFDTVALLSAFRKDRKAAHMRNLAAGAVDPETEGYWDGIIQVVRSGGSDLRKDEETDYYGNRFHGS